MKAQTFRILIFLAILGTGLPARAQVTLKQPLLKGSDRIRLYSQQLDLQDQSEFKSLHWQFVGPTNVSGRATDVEAVRVPGKSLTIWVAAAEQSCIE